MNVDIDNFHSALEKISSLNLLNRCSIVSYDLEFTGIKFENNQRERSQHFPFERYKKMRNVVSRFNIIQLGLTFLVPDIDGVVAYPFNFYLFPRENVLGERVISMQGNTVEFNSSHGMDWNRWIRKGIPFVRISDFKDLENSKKNNKTFDQLVQNAEPETIDTIHQIIDQAKKLDNGNSQILIQIPKASSFYVKKTIDRFSETNSFTIKFWSDAAHIPADKTTVVLQYLSPVQREKLDEKKNQAVFGMTLIFGELWKKGKIFVGHNCMYDLLYIYDSLVDALPESYTVFKEELRRHGNKFYDTKILANLFENKNEIFLNCTTLELLYAHFAKSEKQLINHPKIRLGEGFQGYNLETPVLHEAGFDSYLTGWIFFQMMKKFPDFQKCEGRINVFKSYFEMNIRRSDALAPDLVVFVMMVFPPNKFVQREELWKAKQEMNKQIKDCFKEEGVYQYTICHDGFKEIYIEIKDKGKIKEIATKIIKLTEQKRIPQVHSLPHFIEIKNKLMPADKVCV